MTTLWTVLNYNEKLSPVVRELTPKELLKWKIEELYRLYEGEKK